MIRKLKSEEFSKAQGVLAELHFHLAVTALIEGSSPGEIYVDDISNPQSVFAWTTHRFFLAGQLDNQGFNEGVEVFFKERIYPEGRDIGFEGFTFYYAPDGWGKVIQDVILRDKNPIEDNRLYYEFRDFNHGTHDILPEDFSLLPVDKDLLKKKHLKNLEHLVAEMKSERSSVDSFLENSFGFCFVFGNELAAWCLSEYNSGNRCEVGIETQEAYRRRNLASIAATALVVEAQTRGITQIGWHCYAGNQASIATALKVGFEKVGEYPAVLAMFDETINLGVNGNVWFERGDYGSAIKWYEQAIGAGEAPIWVYWNAACSHAQLNHFDSSICLLNKAIDKGFADVELLKKSRHFTQWHERREWSDLIDKVEAR